MSSLSSVKAKELYESTINDGANRQCIMQIAENDIANLSDVSCDFIILKTPKPRLKIWEPILIEKI
jgi:hypothetical protein